MVMIDMSEITLFDLLASLPKDRLIRVLGEVMAEGQLGREIAQLRQSPRQPTNPRAALLRLTRPELARLLSESGLITLESAWEEYKEYRFTDRPSLYVRAIRKAPSSDVLEPVTCRQQLDAALAATNQTLVADESNPPSKEYAIEGVFPKDENGLVEIHYRVQHRVDLVDPENLQPSIVYTAAAGAIWIDPASQMCLINAEHLADAD
jgi:hypothetical protein